MIIFRQDEESDNYDINDDKPLIFRCSCGAEFRFNEHQDPTTSTGSCRCCGGGSWTIYDVKTGKRLE